MVCWVSFGNDVNTVLTTSLPVGVLSTMVQLAYSVAVIFTFPLQMFPALDIIIQFVEQRMSNLTLYSAVVMGDDTTITTTTTSIPNPPGGGLGLRRELTHEQRTTVVAGVIVVRAIVAVVEMDNLGRVVSLMGSVLGVPLAFIFPPLIHNKIVPSAPKQQNLAVAGAGFLAMIGATLTTLATWNEGGGE